MLVLSRKANQKINIGNDITVVVVAVNGNRVKLGLSAPTKVPIHCDEVHRRMQSEDCQTDAKTCDEASDDSRHEFGEPYGPDRGS